MQGPRVPGKNNFPVIVQICTEGYQRLECFIAIELSGHQFNDGIVIM